MEKAIIKFGATEIEKQKFYQYKRPISKNIDINKIVVPENSIFDSEPVYNVKYLKLK